MAEREVFPDSNGVYTLYDDKNEGKITLTIAPDPNANFTVFIKDETKRQQYGKTWLFNFGIKNGPGYATRVTYNLTATPRKDNREQWYVYYNDTANLLSANGGQHTSPGDPPIGFG